MAGGYYRCLSLFHIDIPLKFGPPFFVFLARDLPSGISPLQELQRRLHLPVVSPPHRHQEGKEQYPENEPKNPPISVHSPIVVHNRNLLIVPYYKRVIASSLPTIENNNKFELIL
jgi:hypothetical protein